MKKLFVLLTMLLTTLCAQAEPLEIAGAKWESSWSEALQRARAENKPILHLQLLGRLDEKWC